MDHHVYKLTEIVGISKEGMDAAIRVALDRARKTVRNVRWFEVVDARGYVNHEGEIDYQVTLKVGFNLED
ncbi:dodecin flavoprotein [Croceicoccus estronivorus]|uniref:dodecin n=1 Tax=Croceicoccus estronivorus TaxID=1172626 RepID=UPI0008337D2A|nr:dodecin [Croceicoccus estronivorus]OCC22520.1 dodecin flavoprotein [Croceicoccus estronivorus]